MSEEKSEVRNLTFQIRDFLDFGYVVVRLGVGMSLLFFKDG